MKEVADRLLVPAIGMIGSYASWEVWQNILVSLFVAFVGGFLAHCGKVAAKKIIEKRRRLNEN